ncbi:MAG: UDP-N-acetylglucosamine 4,6-dehydratase (inverting) [Betaproteobacteria bacterium RIFCSPLOWO2_02_FULL_67_26]|nr:MAG: UDP-N-acetylglucosamine 4,6-dehydratase (inverting) [Betaproteobacteria bacterium RIFCSPLOWO2_02_FULL_67_26]
MSFLEGKSVLVTGATGSFGKRFVKTALERHNPRRLVVFSRDELKQFEMQHRLQSPSLRYFLGDVRDKERLHRAFDGVEVVIHAAAMKQVPASEYNPMEAIKTNIIGAENVINVCIDQGVSHVIALSTDKAVNPVNLYGATKLCADKLFTAANTLARKHRTRFSVVRYGNVIGSRGSVIPFFMQRRPGGVLPITDPKMTRFWITLDQGVRFVLDCLETMQGGEVFVPKIPSMGIMDVARAVGPECRTEVIGIRPGEKLHEMLIPADDAHNTVEFPDHYVIQPADSWWDQRGYVARTGAKPVAPGFEYSSDRNSAWMTPAQLAAILEREAIEL